MTFVRLNLDVLDSKFEQRNDGPIFLSLKIGIESMKEEAHGLVLASLRDISEISDLGPGSDVKKCLKSG